MCRVRSPAVSTESNLRPCGSPLRHSDQSGFASFWSVESPSEFLRPVLYSFVHRVSSSLSSPVDPSFRALSRRFKFTARRHTFNEKFSLYCALQDHEPAVRAAAAAALASLVSSERPEVLYRDALYAYLLWVTVHVYRGTLLMRNNSERPEVNTNVAFQIGSGQPRFLRASRGQHLSHRMCLLIGFRKSTPPQYRQFVVDDHLSRIKSTLLWGR